MTSSLSDEDLMRLVQSGDPSSFTILYERHSAKVWSYISRRLPKDCTEDIYQDCFLKLVEKRHTWNGQPFILWLYVVLKNLINDYYRTQKIERKTLETFILNDDISGVQENFHDLISSMPPETSKLLKEFFEEGWSYKELSAKYEVSEITLRKRMSRAITFLKKGG